MPVWIYSNPITVKHSNPLVADLQGVIYGRYDMTGCSATATRQWYVLAYVQVLKHRPVLKAHSQIHIPGTGRATHASQCDDGMEPYITALSQSGQGSHPDGCQKVRSPNFLILFIYLLILESFIHPSGILH